MVTEKFLPAVLSTNGEITFHEIKGDFCLTIDDIAKGLGYEDSNAIRNLYTRHKDELDNFKGIIKLMTPGGMQEKTVFSEEGIYLISMLARTEKAKEFRLKVATLLKHLRQQKITTATRKAIHGYISVMSMLERKGRDKKWIHRFIEYRKIGLNKKDTAKLLDVSVDTVRRYENFMKSYGLWEVL